MSQPRRDFLMQAALFAGTGASSIFGESIQRAMAIEPATGTDFLDAEHIVVLMQENRSFDHTFGTLSGVRGFEDPRIITLPDGNPVWVQTDKQGKRFLPFRLNLMETQSTWMGSLPHSWTDQVDARNDGKYDRWLIAKKSGNKSFEHMPLALGYYSREDIPFYYALADAFTVCDQTFCSSLTGTTPNRLHLWTGTIRAHQRSDSPANVLNQDVDYGKWANWQTFPERLEDLGVTWKIYQNELSLESGLDPDQDAWLSNFTDNPIEWFEQFGVRYAKSHRDFIIRRIKEIPIQIQTKESEASSASQARRDQLQKEIAELMKALARYEGEIDVFTEQRFQSLSDRSKRLHELAFANNSQDENFRSLTELEYTDDRGNKRQMRVPKGDVLFQFRKDVEQGKLPTVSWLVPPERFSDHPGSPWYGAWFLSETFDILTKNPEVWKKTIFILTYDENDGYFDHVPPFVAPDPANPATGRTSKSIDAGLEFVPLEQDRKWHTFQARNSSIGLGYRIPMIIASPWSRGGAVCSQVFDHTSVLQFMEKFLSHKLGKMVHETNINPWRRTVCGDLTSAFRSADASPTKLKPIDHNQFVQAIHQAKFKELPGGYHALSETELRELQLSSAGSSWMPKQEKGSRPSCPLPYELCVSGDLAPTRDKIILKFAAKNHVFKDKAAGGAFTAYVFTQGNQFYCRNYAVVPGDAVEDYWNLSDFEQGIYRIRVYGPNGYFWSFMGNANDPQVSMQIMTAQPTHDTKHVEIVLNSQANLGLTTNAVDNAYGHARMSKLLSAGTRESILFPTENSHRWYDVSLAVQGSAPFERRFAGRVENGSWGQTDPLIGRRA